MSGMERLCEFEEIQRKEVRPCDGWIEKGVQERRKKERNNN